MIWYYIIYNEYDKQLEQNNLIINPMPDLESATNHVALHPDAAVIKGIRLLVIQKHLEIQDSNEIKIT